MAECDCRPDLSHTPTGSKRLPTDEAWVWKCEHGHEFMRRDPRWERLYTLEELKERLQIGG